MTSTEAIENDKKTTESSGILTNSQEGNDPGCLTDDFKKMEDAEEHPQISEFDELNLKPAVSHGISTIGFTHPSPIQRRAILPAINGRDVIAQAQSGTGKTATFVITVLQRIQTNPDYRVCQAIVLSPTRELAKQTFNVFSIIGRYCDLKIHLCIGGTEVQADRFILNSGVDIIIGTPGRVIHMLNSKNNFNLNNVKIAVLDEADEMFSRGFKGQVYNILKLVNKECQMMLLSATLGNDSLEIASKFMQNPVKILMAKERLTLEGIKQYHIEVQTIDEKYSSLVELFSHIKTSHLVIFASTQSNVHALAETLQAENHVCSVITSKMDQQQRDEVMKNFREGRSRILIATDLISRGIDVHNVSYVINFEMPNDPSVYLHRIGRSGRFGRVGYAINIVMGPEVKILREIEAYYHTQIPALKTEEMENFK